MHAIRRGGLDEAIERALEGGIELLIVGGGDGSINCAVNHLVGKPAVLGVLPLGTGNQLALDLAIPSNTSKAAEIIASGKTARIDLGIANGSYFVNVATVGITSRIARELTIPAKRILGKLAYAFAACRAIARSRNFTAKLITDDGEEELETMQVVIGNGRFHAGPFPLAPDASITDGKLTIYALECESKWGLLKYAFRLPGGRHVTLNEVPVFSTANARLETLPVRPATVDGEISLHTPIDFSVARAVLPVRVPADFSG